MGAGTAYARFAPVHLRALLHCSILLVCVIKVWTPWLSGHQILSAANGFRTIAGCTTTVCHKFTKNLEEHVRRADLVVVAVGKPEFIPGEWIKKGAIVIDVGINRLESGKPVGDVATMGSTECEFYYTCARWSGPDDCCQFNRQYIRSM